MALFVTTRYQLFFCDFLLILSSYEGGTTDRKFEMDYLGAFNIKQEVPTKVSVKKFLKKTRKIYPYMSNFVLVRNHSFFGFRWPTGAYLQIQGRNLHEIMGWHIEHVSKLMRFDPTIIFPGRFGQKYWYLVCEKQP